MARKPYTPVMIGVNAVAEMVGMHKVTIQKRAREGTFPAPTRIGHADYWRRGEVAAWMKAIYKARARLDVPE